MGGKCNCGMSAYPHAPYVPLEKSKNCPRHGSKARAARKKFWDIKIPQMSFYGRVLFGNRKLDKIIRVIGFPKGVLDGEIVDHVYAHKIGPHTHA